MAHTDRNQTIAFRVRKALADSGVTQKDLSLVTGIPERTLARRLAGRGWTLDEIDWIAQALNVTFDELVAA